jgi:tetratricopeptide (TPR) repeat protein
LNIDNELKNYSRKAESLNNIGLIYLDEGNYTVALKRFEEASQIAEKNEDRKNNAKYLNNVGLAYLNEGKYTEAWKKCNQALKIYEELEDSEGMAESQYRLGLTYLEQKSYAEALKNHQDALNTLIQAGLVKSPVVKVLKSNIKLIKSKIK